MRFPLRLSVIVLESPPSSTLVSFLSLTQKTDKEVKLKMVVKPGVSQDFEALRELLKPHIESFDYMVEAGLDTMFQHIQSVEVYDPFTTKKLRNILFVKSLILVSCFSLVYSVANVCQRWSKWDWFLTCISYCGWLIRSYTLLKRNGLRGQHHKLCFHLRWVSRFSCWVPYLCSSLIDVVGFIFLKQCRQAKISYTGRFCAEVCFQYDDGAVLREKFTFGSLPIMLQVGIYFFIFYFVFEL